MELTENYPASYGIFERHDIIKDKMIRYKLPEKHTDQTGKDRWVVMKFNGEKFVIECIKWKKTQTSARKNQTFKEEKEAQSYMFRFMEEYEEEVRLRNIVRGDED